MTPHRIALIPGDGIGAPVTDAALAVAQKAAPGRSAVPSISDERGMLP